MKKQDDFIMLPTVDFCFRELMENPKVRRDFIAALLRMKPENIRDNILLPTVLGRDYPDDKQGILDVRILLWDGTQLNVEMQVQPDEGWDCRAMFYDSKLYINQVKRGEVYEDAKKSIHIGILNFVHNPEDDRCYRTFHFRDDETGALLSDKMEIQIYELKKMAGIVESKEDILVWMKFFSGKNKEELMAMAEKHEFLKEPYNDLLKMSADEIKRVQYEAREKAIMDFNSHIYREKERGIRNLITTCQSLGATKDFIIQKIVDLYHLTLDEAMNKVNVIQ